MYFRRFLTLKRREDYIEKENIKNEISLFIPESLITDKELSNYSISVYCVLHGDHYWNEAHKNGTKSLHITNADVFIGASFTCSFFDGENLITKAIF